MTRKTIVIVLVWMALVGFLLGAGAIGSAFAADSAKSGAEAKKSEGRLPMYFAQIGLDDDQRAKIIAIQADFAGKLKTLESQLESLKKERDAKVLTVLKADQKQKLDDLKTAVKTSRESKKKAVESVKKTEVKKSEVKKDTK